MTVEFCKDHEDPKDSQVLIALTGTPDYIARELLKLAEECSDSYGKPRQGMNWSAEGSRQVITEVWNGQKY